MNRSTNKLLAYIKAGKADLTETPYITEFFCDNQEGGIKAWVMTPTRSLHVSYFGNYTSDQLDMLLAFVGYLEESNKPVDISLNDYVAIWRHTGK